MPIEDTGPPGLLPGSTEQLVVPAGGSPRVSAAQLHADRTGEQPEYARYEGLPAGTPSENLDPPIPRTNLRRGALAELTGDSPPRSIPEVLDRLTAIGDHAAATSALGPHDGIVAFTRLYQDVAGTFGGLADGGRSGAPGFLTRLCRELAERYFAALRHHAIDPRTTPRAWRVLFDNRADRGIPPIGFAVAGVNAHVNLDLAGALLSTWEHVAPDDGGPNSPQYLDYCLLSDVFETAVDPLRAGLGSRTADHLADLVVRFTRDLAWDEAREVWTDGADESRRRASEEKLDTIAGFLGSRLLGTPVPA